jgi:tripartite ATP-independent transporter DctM subunit
MPVAISLGITGVFFFLISKDLPLLTVPTLLFGGISPFALTAITSFIFMGMLVERSGAVHSLVQFANTIVGRVRGGLAHTNVVANMFMAGISGAALADCAAIGSILIPAMKEAGYDKKFSVVITVSASLLGPIIPPSVAMIIYAYAVGGTVSVGGLFMSGVIPGVILGFGMMVLNHFFAVRRNYPINEEAFSLKEFLIRGRKAIWGLMIPAIILGGILLGVFTPTEAGAVAAAYGLFLGAVITRKLTWKDFKECLLEASRISGVIFLMLGSAKIIAHTLTLYDAPVKLAAIMQGLTSSPYVFMFLVITLITLFGFVLEGVAIMIMLVPVLAPVAQIYGIEPHHFGLVVVMAIQLALLTPPVALGLFVGCGIAKVKIEEVVSDVWPYLFLLYAMIIVMACFPGMTLWLPKMLGYVK